MAAAPKLGRPQAGHPQVDTQRGTITLNLTTLVEHARCPICMGIVKDARTVSVCMHRFCKQCIEAWLRTQKENNCPQCRAEFSSRRDCKPDPRFDQLLWAIFGDPASFDERVLEPSEGQMAAAKAVGSSLAAQSTAQKGRAPTEPRAASAAGSAAGKRPPTAVGDFSGDAALHARQHHPNSRAGKRAKLMGRATPPPGAEPSRSSSDTTAALAGGPSPRGGASVGGCSGSDHRGVKRNAGGAGWVAYARTTSTGPHVCLGIYADEEAAARAFDLHTVRRDGRRSLRLNFPHLRELFTALASAGLAAGGSEEDYKAAEGTLKAAAITQPIPPDWKPYKQRGVAASKGAGASPGGVQLKDGGNAAPAPVSPALPPVLPDMGHAGLVTERVVLSAAALRARDLVRQFPPAKTFAAGEGALSRAAFVQLHPADSCPVGWTMRHLICPAGASVAQIKAAIAAGMQQAAAAGDGSDTAAAAKEIQPQQVVLSLVNKLEASADFQSMFSSGPGERLELRDGALVERLMMALADGADDLALECSVRLEVA